MSVSDSWVTIGYDRGPLAEQAKVETKTNFPFT